MIFRRIRKQNMNDDPDKKLSVIIGAYNCASTLPETLDSIISQTFSGFICYVCDDGSSDNTADVIKMYTKKDSRIVFLQNEKNSGLSYTLNKMIRLCNTPFIARMDGDDIAESERFEKQIAFMQNNDEIALCGCSVQYFDDNGIWGKQIYPEHPDRNSFLFVSPFVHPSIMFRTSVLLEMKDPVTGFFYSEDKAIGRSEDYDLFMRMYAKGFKGYNFQDTLLRYREDRNAHKKRKFKYTFAEARVRFRGFKKLHLLPKGFVYVIKPIIIGLIPARIWFNFRKRYFGI